MSTPSFGPQVEVLVNSVFASKKKAGSEQAPSMSPTNFHVTAKIDEESRKDSQLSLSYMLTLTDQVNLVTFEFRGLCNVIGSNADFESLLAADGKNNGSKVPKIVDVMYQRLYPTVFMLAGMTMSTYPQSTGLLSRVVAIQPGADQWATVQQVTTGQHQEPQHQEADKSNHSTIHTEIGSSQSSSSSKKPSSMIVKKANSAKKVPAEKPSEVSAAGQSIFQTPESVDGNNDAKQGEAAMSSQSEGDDSIDKDKAVIEELTTP